MPFQLPGSRDKPSTNEVLPACMKFGLSARILP
jgi:hypothetical protein